MKLGLFAGYWGMGITGAEQLEMAQEADRLGYDSVWAAEAYGNDAATVLAWLAANTQNARIASGIFQIPARTPAMTAMTAATLDNISGGRFILGLGVSGPQVAEGWHGQPFAKPLTRTREYVDIVRKALARETLTYDGDFYKLPLPNGTGLGKPLKLIIRPVQERIPIYLAAIGPKNTALAAEIADGWLPTLFAPEHFDEFRPALEEGAARGGRSLDDLDITPQTSMAIYDDIEHARNFMRPYLALYIGGMGAREKNFYSKLVTRYGYGDAAAEIQDLYLSGKQADAMARIPDDLIDKVALVGPKERVRERLAAYRDAGVETLLVTPAAATHEDRIRMMRDLAEIAA
ncbi:MAG TPA: LLM class F420-dependent oxidoreductase [Solirubrobacterales bacterium]|nr:LLM class F420-dependent oxidoreductase [Solirubrobacterales bacterium]